MSEFKKTTRKPVIDFSLSILTGFFIFIILLFSAAMLILNVNVKKEYLYLFVYFISAVSVFVTAMICCHKSKEKKLIKGLFSTAVLMFIIEFMILSFNRYIFNLKTLLIILIIFIFGFIGCVVGINLKRK